MPEQKHLSDYSSWLGLKTLQSKIFLLIAFFMVAFLSITLIVFYENRLTTSINRKGLDVNAPATINALELATQIRESQKNLYEYLGNPQNNTLLRADSIWSNHIEPTLQKIVNLKPKFASKDDQRIVDSIQSTIAALRQAQSNTMKAYREQINIAQEYKFKDSLNQEYQILFGEKQARLLANNIYQRQVEPISNYLQRLLNRFVQHQQKTLNQNFDSLETSVQVMDISVLVISLFITFLGILLGYVVVNSLQKSIAQPTQLMKRLSQGELPSQIAETQDEFKTIIVAYNQLIETMKKASNFAVEIGNGNLDSTFKSMSEKDILGNSLLQMRERLKKVTEDEKKRSWANEGNALLGDVIRKHNQDLKTLAEQVLTSLIDYVGAIQGGIFVYQENQDEKYLEMIASYAYGRKKFLERKIKLQDDYAETLIGQAYLEQEKIYMTHLPPGYTVISSGLGETDPSSLLITPLRTNQRVEGVMEVIALKPLQPHEIEFIERISETIGVAITSVMANLQNVHLLKDSQVQSEIMRRQEQEMRKNLTEMQFIQEKMHLMQDELLSKEANLSALINSTDESLIAIDTNYHILAINNEVRNRYKNTAHSGIDVGKNVLDFLGIVRDEWKNNYDRAFAGEKFDFVKKTALDGKNAYRHYFVSPILNHNQQIVGASVFSRDISKEKNAEEAQQQKIDSLQDTLIQYQSLGRLLILDWQGNILSIDALTATQLGYEVSDLMNKPSHLLGEQVSKLQKSPYWQGEEVKIYGKDGKNLDFIAQRLRRQEAVDKQIHYLLFPVIFENPISARG